MAIIQQIENGKLVDSSASNTSLSTENKSDAAGGALDKDAFLQLLVAQMQYQDPLEPTDNTEYTSYPAYKIKIYRHYFTHFARCCQCAGAEKISGENGFTVCQRCGKICICKSNQ